MAGGLFILFLAFYCAAFRELLKDCLEKEAAGQDYLNEVNKKNIAEQLLQKERERESNNNNNLDATMQSVDCIDVCPPDFYKFAMERRKRGKKKKQTDRHKSMNFVYF